MITPFLQIPAAPGCLLRGGRIVNSSGGLEPVEIAARLDRLFALAEEYGVDLDLHVDENAVADGTGLEQVAHTVRRRRFSGRVLCGHCCSLTVQPEARQREIIDRKAARTPRWRGVTLPQELSQAGGVPVMLASDNTRDPFYAYGDLDMLEVFSQSVRIGHLDRPFGDWMRAVTRRPACWMGGDASIAEGRRADLVVFDARSFNELLARPQADRVVIRDGRRIQTAPPRFRELDAERRRSFRR